MFVATETKERSEQMNIYGFCAAVLVLGFVAAVQVFAAGGDDGGSPLQDKTLVSWAILDNTTQQGGSALTIQQDDQFDEIVFGEKVPARAGSPWPPRPVDRAA